MEIIFFLTIVIITRLTIIFSTTFLYIQSSFRVKIFWNVKSILSNFLLKKIAFIAIKIKFFFYKRVIKNNLLSKNHRKNYSFFRSVILCLVNAHSAFKFIFNSIYWVRMTLSLNKPVVMQHMKIHYYFACHCYGYYIITDFFIFIFFK